MLLSSAKNFTHYALYYAHAMTTPQFVYDYDNISNSWAPAWPVMVYTMLCCSALIFSVLCLRENLSLVIITVLQSFIKDLL